LNDATLDLNSCLGNNDGNFEWDGQQFSLTANNISLSIENGQPILKAELRDQNNSPVSASINLAERIENQDGEFVFI